MSPPTAPVARTPTPELALVRCFPELSRLPRHALTVLPTPIEQLDRLTRRCGLASLWIKRDDMTGPLYGGNKPRKLEWLLGAAGARGRTGVLTFGGIGTHHGLATAICARDAGLRATLVLLPQPVTPHVLDCLRLDHAVGAELHLAGSVVGAAVTGLRLSAGALVAGRPLAIIPTGGSSSVGAIGYVNAAFELAAQVRAGLAPEPDAIFVPLGSGGTLAGLALGCRLAGLRSRVVAVLVTDILPPSPARLARLAAATLRRLRRAAPQIPDIALRAGDISIVRGYLGAAYGAVTDAGLAAQRMFEEEEGIGLETTYTAKCLAALLDLAAGAPYRGQTLLFWNTYSSVDRRAIAERLPDWRELPVPFHRFFASGDGASPASGTGLVSA
jgi:D-cysteine desulfhydrase